MRIFFQYTLKQVMFCTEKHCWLNMDLANFVIVLFVLIGWQKKTFPAYLKSKNHYSWKRKPDLFVQMWAGYQLHHQHWTIRLQLYLHWKRTAIKTVLCNQLPNPIWDANAPYLYSPSWTIGPSPQWMTCSRNFPECWTVPTEALNHALAAKLKLLNHRTNHFRNAKKFGLSSMQNLQQKMQRNDFFFKKNIVVFFVSIHSLIKYSINIEKWC